jgi:hypothetical protein
VHHDPRRSRARLGRRRRRGWRNLLPCREHVERCEHLQWEHVDGGEHGRLELGERVDLERRGELERDVGFQRLVLEQ